MRNLIVLFLTVALASVATADLSYEINFLDPVQDGTLNYYGITVAGEAVANEIVITTTTDWLSAQIIVNPDQTDAIFQYPFNPFDTDPDSPSQVLIDTGYPPYVPAMPGIEYDTYLSNGVMGEGILIPGGAVDIGGATIETFTTDYIDIAWATNDTDDTGTLRLAMVTLDNESTGSWKLLHGVSARDRPNDHRTERRDQRRQDDPRAGDDGPAGDWRPGSADPS